MGPSGSGKSTLAKIISGELQPQKGKLSGPKKIIYLKSHLLNPEQTILENFLLFAQGDTEEQRITQARMACSDLEITNQLDTQVNKLSTGQFQRAILGLALIQTCHLLILDEPFSHLETPLREELAQVLLPILKRKNISVLWISHDQKLLLKNCSQIALMNFGKIIEIGSPKKLFFHPQNLFTADFLGPCNKEFLSQGFSSVWKVEIKKFKEEKRTLIFYRPESIHLAPIPNAIEAEGKRLSSRFDGNGYLHRFEVNKLPVLVRSLAPLKKNTYKLYFSARDL